MPAQAAIVHSREYWCDIGAHVFPMEKFGLVRERLVTGGEVQDREIIDPAPASDHELLLVHTAEYLDDLAHLRSTPRTMW